MAVDSSSDDSSSDDDSSSSDDLETNIDWLVGELEADEARMLDAAETLREILENANGEPHPQQPGRDQEASRSARSRDGWTGRNDVADGAERQVAPRRRVARAPR